MSRKRSVGWQTLVFSVLVLGFGLTQPADVSAQTPFAFTALDYQSNSGVTGTVSSGELAVEGLAPSPRVPVTSLGNLFLTDIIFSNAGTVSTCGRILRGEEGNADPASAQPVTADIIVPAENTVVISLAAAPGFPSNRVFVESCSDNDTVLSYTIRGYIAEPQTGILERGEPGIPEG